MTQNPEQLPKSIKDWIEFIQAPSYAHCIENMAFDEGKFEAAPWPNIRFGLQGRLWLDDGRIFPIHLNSPGGTVAVTDKKYYLMQVETRSETKQTLIKFAGAYVPIKWAEGVVQAFLDQSDYPLALSGGNHPVASEFFKWAIAEELQGFDAEDAKLYIVGKMSGWPSIVFASILGVAIMPPGKLDEIELTKATELVNKEPGVYKIDHQGLLDLIAMNQIGCPNSLALAHRLAIFGLPKE